MLFLITALCSSFLVAFSLQGQGQGQGQRFFFLRPASPRICQTLNSLKPATILPLGRTKVLRLFSLRRTIRRRNSQKQGCFERVKSGTLCVDSYRLFYVEAESIESEGYGRSVLGSVCLFSNGVDTGVLQYPQWSYST